MFLVLPSMTAIGVLYYQHVHEIQTQAKNMFKEKVKSPKYTHTQTHTPLQTITIDSCKKVKSCLFKMDCCIKKKKKKKCRFLWVMWTQGVLIHYEIIKTIKTYSAHRETTIKT